MTSPEQPAWLRQLRVAASDEPPLTKSLTEQDLWGRHGKLIHRASEFLGRPSFYPVYRYQDYYSYAVLPLIIKKGSLKVNSAAEALATSRGFLYAATNETIDREITRIGGPVEGKNTLRNPKEYAERIAVALRKDIETAETANPDCTNIILCGGRDSLNLLLLPWRNPTIVVSARPNFELVRTFIQENGLKLELTELEDPMDAAVIEHEIMENACRHDLQHARWGAHLCSIAKQRENQVIFWKGQVADAFATPKWMVLTDPPGGWAAVWRKVYKRMVPWVPARARLSISRKLLESAFRRTIWERCAMWQGSHVSLLRAITGCLTLSAYHGSEMNKVFAEVDLPRAVTYDIRPAVGMHLLGRSPVYPDQNPSPMLSSFRFGNCLPERFYELLDRRGIDIDGRGN